MRHSRNIRISPLQNELLCLLEEAGAESFLSILITLMDEAATPEAFLDEVETAVRGLLRLGYCQLYRDLERPYLNYVALTADEVAQAWPLQARLCWDPEQRVWAWRDVAKERLLTGVMITELGFEALRK